MIEIIVEFTKISNRREVETDWWKTDDLLSSETKVLVLKFIKMKHIDELLFGARFVSNKIL